MLLHSGSSIEVGTSLAVEAGIGSKRLERISQFSRLRHLLIIFRIRNPLAERFDDKPGYEAKAVEVKCKTIKSDAGYGGLVKPRLSDATQQQEVEKLYREHGYTLDSGGVLRDARGSRVYGDMDLQGVFKSIGGRYRSIDTNDPEFITGINKVVFFDKWLTKHGAENDFRKVDPATGTLVPGRIPDADENYLVIEEGRVFAIRTPRTLHQYYLKKGLPWMYGTCY